MDVRHHRRVLKSAPSLAVAAGFALLFACGGKVGGDDGSSSGGASSGGGAGTSSSPLTWTAVTAPPGAQAFGSAHAGWESAAGDVYVVTGYGVLHGGASGAWVNELGPDAHIVALWGSGPADVYALAGSAPVAVLHSTGDGTWSAPVDLPGMSGGLAIWGSGPGDVYVVGAQGTVAHSTDGASWQLEDGGTKANLLGVWGSGPRDVYATASSGAVLHFDGASWQSQTVAQGEGLGAIWGSAASDVYVGGVPNQPGTADVFDHSIGDGTWASEGQAIWDAIPPGAGVDSMWGSGAGDVYAVEVTGTDSNSRSAGMLVHTGGDGTWAPVDAANALLLDPIAVWGNGPDDVWVAGLGLSNGTVLIHGTR